MNAENEAPDQNASTPKELTMREKLAIWQEQQRLKKGKRPAGSTTSKSANAQRQPITKTKSSAGLKGSSLTGKISKRSKASAARPALAPLHTNPPSKPASPRALPPLPVSKPATPSKLPPATPPQHSPPAPRPSSPPPRSPPPSTSSPAPKSVPVPAPTSTPAPATPPQLSRLAADLAATQHALAVTRAALERADAELAVVRARALVLEAQTVADAELLAHLQEALDATLDDNATLLSLGDIDGENATVVAQADAEVQTDTTDPEVADLHAQLAAAHQARVLVERDLTLLRAGNAVMLEDAKQREAALAEERDVAVAAATDAADARWQALLDDALATMQGEVRAAVAAAVAKTQTVQAQLAAEKARRVRAERRVVELEDGIGVGVGLTRKRRRTSVGGGGGKRRWSLGVSIVRRSEVESGEGDEEGTLAPDGEEEDVMARALE
ncbi:hypothetical protein AMAG_13857 [Allomyces macrogynus ATCC 38327]|uniref:Uncharacterized protein n=1 Tax=Allomyces macrogynus (strain ATCC 38327) TaxID=578462 RepID=A0A0L0T2M9_ALLM3|nr:hypothetical protein AMAG_13857 [Allomyces macrogynus ATCC 38327]|eukprot:KNE68981.1 hypothetical protein AMAG_13857 [Allomyces macrogynus ATCC 38327]